MMKYRVPFVIATASIWLISCSRSPEQQVEVFEPEYHIKNHVYVDSIKSEDLIENFEYISLETRDDCLVGEVDDLQIVDDKLYIVSDDRVLVFDFDGKFIFKIDQINRIFKSISTPLYQPTPTPQTVYENRFYKVLPNWLVMFMKYNMAEKGFQLDADHRDYGIYKAVVERTESDNPLIARFDLKR